MGMKKRFQVFLTAFVLMLSVLLPNSTALALTKEGTAQLQVSRSLLSMTEARDVTVEVDLGYKADLSEIEWSFGGKPLNAWRKWNKEKGDFTGKPYITFKQTPHYVEGTTKIRTVLRFDLLFDTNDLSPRSIRVKYPQFIDYYNLAVKDPKTGTETAASLKLNVYDSYRKYEEIKPEVDRIFKEKKENRYAEYKSIGQTVQGRDMHFVVLAKNQAAVDTYLNETLPQALENPEQLQKDIESGKLEDYQVPIWFNNIHPDESPGVDAMLDLLEKFAKEESVSYETSDDQGNPQTVTLDVNDALDNFIFIFNLAHNGDGRVHNTRHNANGFDLNRDNGYQTQKESVIVTQEIAKWTPMSLLELHGFVKGFLIEPCTPPHNPNFEYDLLVEGMLDHAHAMGRAGVANTAYEKYEIPLVDYENGWDDATTAYTAMYAMFHGAMGHTVEIPDLNEESNQALIYASFGAVKYALDHKEALYMNQLEIFKRGVNGEDNKAVDEWLVNQDGKVIGRDREKNQSFFPDYYVLPVSDSLQKNDLEAYNMVDYLIRNGVNVEQTTKEVTVKGVKYPEGSFIVPMHQAKRGFANAVLAEGEDVSDWDAMYDSVITNFPDLRGFDHYAVYQKNAFKNKANPITKVDKPSTQLDSEVEAYVVGNTNNDAVKLVNELLAQGKDVQYVTKTSGDYHAGDFVVMTKDLSALVSRYMVDVTPLKGEIESKKLEKKAVYAAGSAASKFVLKELGFVVAEEADGALVFDDQGKAKIEKGQTYILSGGGALKNVKDQNIVPGLEYGNTDFYHEGLLKMNVTPNHPYTSGYEEEDWLYTGSGTWVKTLPAGAQTLLKVSSDKEFYKAGWWPGKEQAKGQIMAFSWEQDDYHIVAYANDLTFRAHTKQSYRFLSNAIFANSLEK
jgi:murein tripeptide amidase MpaA